MLDARAIDGVWCSLRKAFFGIIDDCKQSVSLHYVIIDLDK